MNEDRDLIISQKVLDGEKLEAVGNEYGLTRQRVQQIFRKRYPNLLHVEYGRGKRKYDIFLDRQDTRTVEVQYLYNRARWYNLTDLERAQGLLFTRKKQNNRASKKWEWDLVMSDLKWPTHCPVFGIELDWFSDGRQENSPSFDRIDSLKGYVKGNVYIISWRANRIKNDGTADEHLKIAEYLTRSL